MQQIIVSDENILGSMRGNIASCSLYPDLRHRVERHIAAFAPHVSGIHLSMRALDTYWISLISFSLPRGMRVPSQAKLKRLAEQSRNWRDVITDIARAAPGVPITVAPYESHAAHPDLVLAAMLGAAAPPPPTPIWRNARPQDKTLLGLPLDSIEITRLATHMTGTHWQPFALEQRAALQERYADDMFWLSSGADGLAQLVPRPLHQNYAQDKAPTQGPSSDRPRGQIDDRHQRLESARRG